MYISKKGITIGITEKVRKWGHDLRSMYLCWMVGLVIGIVYGKLQCSYIMHYMWDERVVLLLSISCYATSAYEAEITDKGV